jgi:hypothetical protein
VIAIVAVVAVVVAVGAFVALRGGGGNDSASSPTTAATIPGGARPTGTVTVGGAPPANIKCPLDSCMTVNVTCPEIEPMDAILAVGEPQGTPTGVIVLFSGGTGASWWATPTRPVEQEVLTGFQAKGLEVIEVAWPDAWGTAPPSQAVGFAKLSCRPATIVKWAHDERYAPMGVSAPARGECGFCISGNSGGSSQAAYALTHYGLAPIVDAAILSSGPPHSDIARGCSGKPDDTAFQYDPDNVPLIDGAYGHLKDPGPCASHDASFASLWTEDGVATGGAFYNYPNTRVSFLFGGRDPTVAPTQAQELVDKLKQAGSPMVSAETVASMPHSVNGNPDSRAAVTNAVLDQSG